MGKFSLNRLSEFYSKNTFWVNFALSFLAILLLYHVKFGLGILDPTNIGWLMQWDLHGYVVVLDVYRHEPWGFPIGEVHNYFYPVGANVGELLPIMVKLFSPILPETFQYIGLFLLTSHVLVVYYSLKIFKLFKVTGLVQLLATLLIMINPVLLYRFIHPSLTAHWLILASLWLYFVSTTKTNPTRVMVYQGVLFVLSGLIFPYLTVILTGFLIALSVKLWLFDRTIKFSKLSVYLFLCFGILFLCWYVVGLISFNNSVEMAVADAYGRYGWNLSSFYNAFDVDINGYYKTTNLSSLLPAFPMTSWAQFEGFSYLGLGMILLVLLAILLFVLKKRPSYSTDTTKTNIYPLAIFTILITLFAISNTVTFNDVVLFKIPLPSLLQKIGDIFRASGRFIWVAYYFILIGTLYFLASVIKSKQITVALFLGALCLQVYDLKAMIWTDKFPYEEYHTPLHDNYWETLVQQFDNVMFYPPFVTSNLTHDDYRYFTYFASKYRKPVSTGYLGRIDFTATRAFSKKMTDSIKANSFNDRWLYITLPHYAPELLKGYHEGKIQVISLDGYLVFYSSSRQTDLEKLKSEIGAIADQGTLDNLFKLYKLEVTQMEKSYDDRVKIGMYEVIPSQKLAYIKGWAFIEGTEDLETDSVQLLLQSRNGKILSVPAKRFMAPDVSAYFNNPKLNGAGFSVAISTEGLQNGSYRIGVSIQNKNIGEKIYQWSGASFESENFSIVPTVRTKSLPEASKEVVSSLDSFVDNKDEFSVEGWLFVKDQHSNSQRRKVILSSPSKIYSFNAIEILRPDVASHFKDSLLIASGIKIKSKKKDLEKGVYSIGFLISDSLKNTEYFLPTDKNLTIGYPEFATPSLLTETPTGQETVRSFFDKIEEQNGVFHINGWAFISDLSTDFSETQLILKSADSTYSLIPTPLLRRDIQSYFKLSYNVDFSGFSAKFRKQDLPSGKYQVCVLVLNKKTNVKTLQCLETTIKI